MKAIAKMLFRMYIVPKAQAYVQKTSNDYDDKLLVSLINLVEKL